MFYELRITVLLSRLIKYIYNITTINCKFFSIEFVLNSNKLQIQLSKINTKGRGRQSNNDLKNNFYLTTPYIM